MRYLKVIVLVFVSLVGWSQTLDELGLFPHYRNHTFYTIGAISARDKSPAKVNGLGLTLSYAFTKKWGIELDYGRSFADSFVFATEPTQRFFINQYAVRFAYSFASFYGFQPSFLIGYGATHINDLQALNLDRLGMDVQLAVQLNYTINDKYKLQYQFAYQFSLHQNFPHSLRSQVGVLIHPFRRIPDKELQARLGNAYAKLLAVEDQLELEQSKQQALEHKLNQAKQDQQKLQNDINRLKEKGEELHLVLRENQRLLEEVRYYQKKVDSMLFYAYDSLIACNLRGERLTQPVKLEEGYYAAIYGLDSARLITIFETSPYLNTMPVQVFWRKDAYQLLVFLDKELEGAREEYLRFEIPEFYNLVKIK